MNESYKRNPNAKCLVCKKPIYRRPFEIQKNKNRVFCSMICYGIFCRKESPCTVCKNPVLASKNKKTCSRSCANKHRKGIKYKLSRPKDKVKSQRSLKTRLLKLRGKSCERCKFNKYEILEMHHKNRNRNDNEMNNLELLCPNCHAEEHYLNSTWLKDSI